MHVLLPAHVSVYVEEPEPAGLRRSNETYPGGHTLSPEVSPTCPLSVFGYFEVGQPPPTFTFLASFSLLPSSETEPRQTGRPGPGFGHVSSSR